MHSMRGVNVRLPLVAVAALFLSAMCGCLAISDAVVEADAPRKADGVRAAALKKDGARDLPNDLYRESGIDAEDRRLGNTSSPDVLPQMEGAVPDQSATTSTTGTPHTPLTSEVMTPFVLPNRPYERIACVYDANCDDGLFCNGAEQCVRGTCHHGQTPCSGLCDEALVRCVDCLTAADCDDGEFCNGTEACVDGVCDTGSGPFLPGVAVGSVLSSDVVEASGLAASRRNPGVLWTHDDSGGANVVFAINTSGRLLGTYQLGSGSLTDAEDIAVGPGPTPGVNYIYVGDIGDNSSVRSTIRVKRVPEPAVELAQAPTYVTLTGVATITLRYPSGADAPAHKDAEAMFVDTNGDIYLVTKRIYPNKVYRASFPQSTSSTITLEYVTALPTGPGLAWITGADCSADGQWLIVTNDQDTDYANLWYRQPGTPLVQAFADGPCPLVRQAEPQGEAVAWDADGLCFFTLSEAHSASEPLWCYTRAGSAD